MIRRESRLPPFDPPPVTVGDDDVCFQSEMQALAARRLVKRFRSAGIHAFMERARIIGTLQVPGNMVVYNLFVARPQYICALILWRLRTGDIGTWNRMNRAERSRIAIQALVDGTLAGSNTWEPGLFSEPGLAWLQDQLGGDQHEFRKLLAKARKHFNQISRRDLRLGTVSSLICLVSGTFWGWWYSFGSWPTWVAILLGVLFGGHTLIYTLPRVLGAGASRETGSHSALRRQLTTAPPQAAISNQRKSKATDRVPTSPATGAGTPYPDLVRSMDDAKEYLNRGDAASALNLLEKAAARDIRGVHTTHPDYLRLLKICRQSLGMNMRNVDNQLAEVQWDWIMSLKKGEEALRYGNAEESIIWFRRSLMDNPGEAGTASGEAAARKGIRAAEQLIKRKTTKNQK